MFRLLPVLFLLPLSFLTSSAVQAQQDQVRAELIADVSEIRPGDSFRAGVRFTIADGWHIYGEDPGLTGLPTKIDWQLPDGASAGPVHYPPTVPFLFLGEPGDGYTETVVLWSTIQTSPDLTDTLTIEATASWLVCREVCMPGKTTVSLTLPIGPQSVTSENAALFVGDDPTADAVAADTAVEVETSDDTAEATNAQAGRPLVSILLFGLTGGLILNLMPCVFPILGLKIMGFVNQAGADRAKVAAHGLVFTAGVLLSFWILAGVLLILRFGGEELGWGFQLQEPVFVLALTVVLLVFGLNMSGVFEFGLSAVGAGSKLTAKGGMAGSFFSGVLATVVATPCAAPFLAPALGAALTIPPAQSIAAFTAIAIGLSLPYLILSLFPDLVKLLPRPGGWMETLKQFLAFLLYGTVAYLLWVLAGQVEPELLLQILFGLVVIALGCWVYGRWSTPSRPRKTQWLARAATALLLILPLAHAVGGIAEQKRRQEQIASGEGAADFLVWQDWNPEKVQSLRADGRFIYIDFTARWCATCQWNKRAYDDPKVIQAFLENDVVLLKADWTNQDPEITRALAEFGRSAVPFNLLYAPGREEPLIMPELFGAGTVLQKLEEVGAQLPGG